MLTEATNGGGALEFTTLMLNDGCGWRRKAAGMSCPSSCRGHNVKLAAVDVLNHTIPFARYRTVAGLPEATVIPSAAGHKGLSEADTVVEALRVAVSECSLLLVADEVSVTDSVADGVSDSVKEVEFVGVSVATRVLVPDRVPPESETVGDSVDESVPVRLMRREVVSDSD